MPKLSKPDVNRVKKKTKLSYQQVQAVAERYGLDDPDQTIEKIKELGLKPKRWKRRIQCRTQKRGS